MPFSKHPIFKSIALAVLSLIGLLVVSFALLLWQLSIGPIQLSKLTPDIQRLVSSLPGGYAIQMEGIELVKAVRADERISKTPILMVTAEAKRDQIIAAAQAGVNDYIVKPFTPDTLRTKVERIFKALAAK